MRRDVRGLGIAVLGMGLMLGSDPRPATAHAQTAILEHAPAHRLSAAVGWDSTWVTELAYAQAAGLGGPLQDAQWYGVLTLPPMALVGVNVRATFGAGVLLPADARWCMGVAVAGGLVVADDATGRKLGLPLQLALQPGYFADRWHAALDLGWHVVAATRIWHSDAVADLYRDRYPEMPDTGGPRNGWYAATAERWHAGVTGRVMLGGNLGAFGAGGFEYQPNAFAIVMNGQLGQLPFYAAVGGFSRW